jgi:hypothetical protein
MADVGTTSSYYLQIEGIITEETAIKGLNEISYESTSAGSQKPIGSGKKGSLYTNVSGGYRTQASMSIDVYVSADSSTASYKLREWFKKILPSSSQGSGQWKSNRKNGTLTLKAGPDASAPTLKQWNFTNMWVQKYTLSATNVTGQELLTETFEFAADNIKPA